MKLAILTEEGTGGAAKLEREAQVLLRAPPGSVMQFC